MSRKLRVVANGMGEVIPLGSMAVRILEDGSLTDNRIGAVIVTLPPQTNPIPQHLHRMHDETFLVTQGTVRFAVKGEEHDVRVGEYVVVPTSAPHTFSNPFDEPAAFFNTFTPAYYVNYFRELGKLISGEKHPSAEDMIKVRDRYATDPA